MVFGIAQCVFVYAKSVGSWMRRLGHMHIQLYNETFIVHANTSTSVNQLKYNESKKYYTSRTVPKFNLRIVEDKSIPLKHIYMTTRLPCLV
jgi:hypothetical protein